MKPAASDLRKAVTFVESMLQFHRVPLSADLRAHGGQVLLERYFQLINHTAFGQLATSKLYERQLPALALLRGGWSAGFPAAEPL